MKEIKTKICPDCKKVIIRESKIRCDECHDILERILKR